MTQCNTKTRLDFRPRLPIDVEFSAEDISRDGGLLLLRQAEDEIGVCKLLSVLVPDDRNARRVRHRYIKQMEQRVFQICMGYEDCNDAARRILICGPLAFCHAALFIQLLRAPPDG